MTARSIRWLPLAAWAAFASVSTARAEPRQFTVDVAASRLAVHVDSKGWAGPLGVLHDHEFLPRRWSGALRFDPEQPSNVSGTITIQADDWEDRQPALSASEKAKVERQIASPAVLDAARYPEIVLDVTGFQPEGTAPANEWTGTLTGELTLHGQTHPVEIPVEAALEGGTLTATGSFDVRQSRFGIDPWSRYFGAVRVADRVRIRFNLTADESGTR